MELQLLGGFIMLAGVFGQLGIPVVLIGVALAVIGLVDMSRGR